LEKVGVSYDEVVQAVEDEGVDKFAASWKELQDTVQAALKGDPDVEGSK
ncbi:MAG: transaldolase, partial [Geodermatophilaceae bacterium]|nr:transaldolase [Geodermatophilaceae bacterium]